MDDDLLNDSTELLKHVERIVDEVSDLRFGTPRLHADASPSDIIEALQDVRQRLDRVEFLLVNAMRTASTLQAALHVVQADSSDAFDTAITGQRNKNAPLLGGEYTSAKERQAAANIAIIDKLRAGRKAQLNHRMVADCVETVKVMHRGLESVRHDYLGALRAHQFETVLDR